MEILTPRLILRTAADSDYNSMAHVYSDLETIYNLFGRWRAWTSHESRIQHQRLMSGHRERPYEDIIAMWDFVIALKTNNKMIGAGSIQHYPDFWEFSVVLDPRYRGQGYAAERLEAIIRFVREIDPNARIRVRVLKTNFESQSLIKRFKFKQEQTADPKVNTYWLEPQHAVARELVPAK